MAKKPQTNTAKIVDAMKFSNYGALAQVFIMDAIYKQGKAVEAASLEDLENPMINAKAWQGVAIEILNKLFPERRK